MNRWFARLVALGCLTRAGSGDAQTLSEDPAAPPPPVTYPSEPPQPAEPTGEDWETEPPASEPPASEPPAAPHDLPEMRRGAYTHDGFFMRFQGGPGLFWLSSDSSISNGFQQRIQSTAFSMSAVSGSMRFGGSPTPGFVIGGALSHSAARGPVVRSLGREFRVRELQAEVTSLGVFATYYPDPRDGWNFTGELGMASLHITRSVRLFDDASHLDGSESLSGPTLSGAGGYEWWIHSKWSVGFEARLSYYHLSGRQAQATGAATWLSAVITLH